MNAKQRGELKGPYAMIWNGQKWIWRGLDQQQININEQDNDSSDKISFMLKGFIRAIAPLFSENNNFKLIKHSFIENVIIICVMTPIFLFVNYVDYFRYEQNILINEDYNLLSIFLLCFGLCSPFLVLLNYFGKIIQNICSIVVFVVFTLIPVILIMSKTQMESLTDLHIFTIQTNSNGPFVDILASFESSQSYLEEKYKTSDIYWDTTCKDTSFVDKSLLFVNLMNSNCMHLVNDNNITVPIISVDDVNKQRLSSPKKTKFNLHYLESSLLMKNSNINVSENTNYIFIGNLSYIIYVLEKNMVCSLSKYVELTMIKTYKCKPYKYLSHDGMVYEQKCIEIMNLNQSINVFCDRFNSSFRLRKNGIKIEPNTLSIDNMGYTSCCINNTYLVRSFGDCILSNVINVDSMEFHEKGLCGKGFSQWNIGYRYLDNCLYKVEYKSSCNQYNIKYPGCFGLQCNIVL